MYTTVAAGMIADELPKDLVSKFLEAIQENEATVYYGVAPPSSESKDQEMTDFSKSSSMPQEKKRDIDELENSEIKGQGAQAENP